MPGTSPSILFGPAGWHYADWEGHVFPAPIPPGFSRLAFVAAGFDFVEVNTTFYRIPPPGLASGWVNQVRDIHDFSFWVKLHRTFTHEREAGPGEVSAFHECVAPLREAGLLRGILAQFPYSFHESSENLDWIKQIRESFFDIPLAVEFRHRTWNRDHVLTSFRQSGLTWVNIDQPRVSRSLPLTAYTTHAETAYLRLHGRNSANWFSGAGRDARYDYSYSAGELSGIGDIIRKMAERFSGKIYVSGNNHYKGQALRNLKALKRELNLEEKINRGIAKPL